MITEKFLMETLQELWGEGGNFRPPERIVLIPYSDNLGRPLYDVWREDETEFRIMPEDIVQTLIDQCANPKSDVPVVVRGIGKERQCPGPSPNPNDI